MRLRCGREFECGEVVVFSGSRRMELDIVSRSRESKSNNGMFRVRVWSSS